ncbi:hypothetical protein RintRC_5234 [Richelia intracellularis]|nr:hypothetical protein RintRC_5234 [Richelia intracellularis]
MLILQILRGVATANTDKKKLNSLLTLEFQTLKQVQVLAV